MSIPYRRLDPSKREIRLLEIQSARDISDPVECRLVTVSLNDNVDFIALSSRLGDATDLDKIWVSGRPVNITTHLSSALKHIRAVFYPTISKRFQRTPARKPHGAPRWLRQLFGSSSSKNQDDDGTKTLRVWFDLVCVNQRDEFEKSKQVVTRRNVHRAAELVVGWLGEKSEHTDAAMRTLGDIEDAMPPAWGDPGDKEKHPEDYSPTHQWAARGITHIWSAPEGVIPFTLPHWLGCNDFMERQYFKSCWLLEEVAMARYPTFMIGDIIVPWKQVLRLNRLMEEFKYQPSVVFPKVCTQDTSW